jgi:hypothetical protein
MGTVKRSTGANERARQIGDEAFRGLPAFTNFKKA